MNKPLLIIFVGVPGSGKTTFARQLAAKLNAVTINSDAMRLSMWGSREIILENHQTQPQRQAANKLTFGALDYAAGQVIKAGHSVVYDCNANKKAERQQMRSIAELNNGKAIIVRISVPRELAIERLSSRSEADDAPRPNRERASEVVDRFIREIEEPSDKEHPVAIDGRTSFERQHELFQLAVAEDDVHEKNLKSS